MADVIKQYTLVLTEAERTELLRVLEDFLMDTRAEDRRTENPNYRSELRQEENVLQTLLKKLRQVGG